MALAEGMFWAKKAPTHPNDLNSQQLMLCQKNSGKHKELNFVPRLIALRFFPSLCVSLAHSVAISLALG